VYPRRNHLKKRVFDVFDVIWVIRRLSFFRGLEADTSTPGRVEATFGLADECIRHSAALGTRGGYFARRLFARPFLQSKGSSFLHIPRSLDSVGVESHS